jgi:uncharacterized BrkB/YihY/UPF0761 family membrane protein
MKAKIYLILGAAAVIGAIAAFGFFIYTMMSGDIFEEEFSPFNMVLRTFLLIGVSFILMFLAIFFFARSTTAQNEYNNRSQMKKCISCGAVIGVTEMSCPRCFVLQPVEHNNDPMRRK